jgi:hypothetical protein
MGLGNVGMSVSYFSIERMSAFIITTNIGEVECADFYSDIEFLLSFSHSISGPEKCFQGEQHAALL